MSRIARIVKSPLFLGSVVIGATGAGYAGYYYSHDIQKILQNYGIENQSEKAYNALGEATTGLKKALHRGLESAGFVATDDLDKPKPIEKLPKVKDVEKKAQHIEQPKPAVVKLTTVEELAPPQPTAMPTTPLEAKQIDIKPVEIHKEPPKLEATPPQKMEMQSSDTSLEIESKIRKERQKWEADADAQLKRIAQEHAEHLQKVIKTQKQLHDIENEHRIEERVKIEQNKFGKQIETAVGKLNEIEEALNSRSAQDLENRRAKIFWTCCQNLMESLVSGGEKAEQYSVILNEVKFIKNLAENDDFAQSICNCFPEQAVQSGIATENGLKQRFAKVYKLARRTAQIDENGGGPFQYFTSWLHSIFVLQFASVKYSADDKIDLNTYEPYELLGRIQRFVADGDFTNAVKLANLLRGESASIFRDWIFDAQLHLHSRFLAEILLSHAQVSSIRTTY